MADYNVKFPLSLANPLWVGAVGTWICIKQTHYAMH